MMAKLLPLLLASASADKLVKVIVLGRHGNRLETAPLQTLCPAQIEWAKGKTWDAALSPLGEVQCSLAGTYLRQAYVGASGSTALLDHPKDDHSTFFLAENADRNVQCIDLVKGSLFPQDRPTDDVPVFTTTPGKDTVMNNGKNGPCIAARDEIVNEWDTTNEPVYKKKHGPLLKELSEVCGFDFLSIQANDADGPFDGKSLRWALKQVVNAFEFSKYENLSVLPATTTTTTPGPTTTVTSTTTTLATTTTVKQAPYVKLSRGSAACPPDTVVNTLEECETARQVLGIYGLGPNWVGEADSVPVGCNVREIGSDPKLHFNTGNKGAGRNDLSPICLAHPKVTTGRRLAFEYKKRIATLAKQMMKEADYGKDKQVTYLVGDFPQQALFDNIRKPHPNETHLHIPLQGVILNDKKSTWAQTPLDFYYHNRFLVLWNHRELLTGLIMLFGGTFADGSPVPEAVHTAGMLIWEVWEEGNNQYIKYFHWELDHDPYLFVDRSLPWPHIRPEAVENASSVSIRREIFPNFCEVRGRCTLKEFEGMFETWSNLTGSWREICGAAQQAPLNEQSPSWMRQWKRVVAVIHIPGTKLTYHMTQLGALWWGAAGVALLCMLTRLCCALCLWGHDTGYALVYLRPGARLKIRTPRSGQATPREFVPA